MTHRELQVHERWSNTDEFFSKGVREEYQKLIRELSDFRKATQRMAHPHGPYAEFLKRLKALADAGDTQAEHLLNNALDRYRRCAAQGDPHSQEVLAEYEKP